MERRLVVVARVRVARAALAARRAPRAAAAADRDGAADSVEANSIQSRLIHS